MPSTIRYGEHADQFVEIWDPTSSPRGTTVLIHGGYWRDRYGLDLMHPMAEHLSVRGWRVVNIEYRRLAEHDDIWDDLSADVLSAVELALADDGLEPAPRPVVAIGHSAGGHLALWASATTTTIGAVVALAPVADLAEADRLSLSEGVVRRLLGGSATQQPERYRSASPIRLVPLGAAQLVIHGDVDDAVPQEISVAYASAAQKAGDDVELVTPSSVDHFDIIDPAHEIWRLIDGRMDSWTA